MKESKGRVSHLLRDSRTADRMSCRVMVVLRALTFKGEDLCLTGARETTGHPAAESKPGLRGWRGRAHQKTACSACEYV